MTEATSPNSRPTPAAATSLATRIRLGPAGRGLGQHARCRGAARPALRRRLDPPSASGSAGGDWSGSGGWRPATARLVNRNARLGGGAAVIGDAVKGPCGTPARSSTTCVGVAGHCHPVSAWMTEAVQTLVRSGASVWWCARSSAPGRIVMRTSAPPDHGVLDASAPHHGTLERLRSQGVVGAYGIPSPRIAASSPRRCLRRRASGRGALNALHQEPLAGIEQAARQGVGVIVKVPLASGWLSGRYRAASTFDGVRSRWTRGEITRRARLVQGFARSLPEGTPPARGRVASSSLPRRLSGPSLRVPSRLGRCGRTWRQPTGRCRQRWSLQSVSCGSGSSGMRRWPGS
jgi:hypothetical protein